MAPKELEIIVRLGANIRRLRLKAGMTQAALAEASGLSSVAVSLIEGGKKDLRVSTLVMLAKALHAAPADLLKKPGRPKPKKR